MKTESDINKPSSATRFTTEPSATESDADYLNRQITEGKAALKRTLADFKRHMSATLDPALWAREHPWATIGAAAIGAFAAVAIAIPSRQESELRKRAAYERAVNGNSHPGGAASGKTAGSSTFMTVVRELFNLLKPMLTTLITASVSSKLNPEPPHEPPHEPASASATTEYAGGQVDASDPAGSGEPVAGGNT